MGMVHADIELINAFDIESVRRGHMDQDEIRQATVKVLVDSGAFMLAINEHIKEMLGLYVEGKERAVLANGEVVYYDVVSTVRIKFGNRTCTCDAIVLPGDSEPLLGTIPMEAMDLIIHPKREELITNPEHGEHGLYKLVSFFRTTAKRMQRK